MMLIKTSVATWLLAVAAAGCQNASHPVNREPTVKVISVERLGDAPEHPTTSEQAQARLYEPVIRRRAPSSRFDVPARDEARIEPGSTEAWPPAREDEIEGQGEGAGASPFSETSSGHGTTTNTGVNTENQGNAGTDDPQR